MTFWRLSRKDIPSLMLIALLPLALALPQFLGWLNANPMLYVGGMTRGFVGGLIPGYPYIDPNNGFTTQTLGYRAMMDWLQGQPPWWNPYSGVGLPLAAEYQPAAFFPLTPILLLPQGMVWQHLLLQVLAGWGTYALLRQMGLGRLAAATGGLLYGFNGTLAWFDHASALPVPFLPWMLLGIERARAKATLGLPGGWRLFAVAMALSLLAGFPETAYINGLLALAWAALRWAQSAPDRRLAYAWRIALGGVVGVALAAPQIWAFVTFLPHAGIGGHGGFFAHVALDPAAALPSLIAPYVYGPIFAFSGAWQTLGEIWSNIGGYGSVIVLILAAYGFLAHRGALGWLLLVWCALTLAKTFGLAPVVTLWNMVPGIPQTAFYRYAPPSWELALAILAAWGLDDLAHAAKFRRGALLGAALVLVVALGGGFLYGAHLWPHLRASVDLHIWAMASALWAILTALVCFGLMVRASMRWRTPALATLFVANSMLMFAIPTLSNPRGGTVDMPAINFLRENLGLQRFYSLGPIQPNYGAYFGIASINHNYVPVSKRWASWVQAHLDTTVLNQFTGNSPRGKDQPSPAQELRRNLTNYEWVGVKYVLAPGRDNPFIETLSSQTSNSGNQPLVLRPGLSASATLPAEFVTHAATINAVGVFQGNYYNTANGMLKIVVCSGPNCASGTANIAESINNQVFYVPLSSPLQLTADTPVRLTFIHEGGARPLALWAYPTIDTADAQRLIGPVGTMPGMGLQIHLRIASPIAQPKKRVYADELMSIYELPNHKPYFEAAQGSCIINPISRTIAMVNCKTPCTLLRRELFYPGWKATSNGKDVHIVNYKGLFQAIDLPQGINKVEFSYAPPHIDWAWLFMWLGVCILAFSGLKSRVSGQRGK